MTESLLAFSLESNERARISAIAYAALIVLILPFGRPDAAILPPAPAD